RRDHDRREVTVEAALPAERLTKSAAEGVFVRCLDPLELQKRLGRDDETARVLALVGRPRGVQREVQDGQRVLRGIETRSLGIARIRAAKQPLRQLRVQLLAI